MLELDVEEHSYPSEGLVLLSAHALLLEPHPVQAGISCRARIDGGCLRPVVELLFPFPAHMGPAIRAGNCGVAPKQDRRDTETSDMRKKRTRCLGSRRNPRYCLLLPDNK